MIMKLKNRTIRILYALATGGDRATKDIITALASDLDVSAITLQRDLAALTKSNLILRTGSGPSTKYSITAKGRIFLPVNAKLYCEELPDTRIKPTGYDFNFFHQIKFPIFSTNELAILNASTTIYKKKHQRGATVAVKKELERFIIELAWKSSRIEGNTYNLLDTEKLLIQGIQARGHSKDEATMIINHKKAFDYIFENKNLFKKLTSKEIEAVHHHLVAGLGVRFGIRKTMVGITGTAYEPLSNPFKIAEALRDLCATVNHLKNVFDKSLLTLAGIAYIQAFEDGNKRTSRLMANAVLLAHGAAPISYRSINEDDYRDAILVFYELRSLEPLKKLFIEQYQFAAGHYSI